MKLKSKYYSTALTIKELYSEILYLDRKSVV